jgi:mono/diheme cytochrome c family protein
MQLSRSFVLGGFEHFQEKWKLVFRPKMRQCKNARAVLFSCLGGTALAAVALATPLHAQSTPNLPPGEGRDLVASVCTGCHALTTIVQIRDGSAGWRQFVNYMIMKGAQVSQHDSDTIVQYLTINFGPNSPPAAGAPPPIVAALPAGAGKDLVESRCVTCHDLTRIVASRRQKPDWDAIVANMVNRGATATADERQTIVTYLATQFGE